MIDQRIDCHAHAATVDLVQRLAGLIDEVGHHRINLVCMSQPGVVNENPAGIAAKHLFPGRFYVFGGMDHSFARTEGRTPAPPLDEQVDRLRAIGLDGVKMIEGKPGAYHSLGRRLDGPYLEPLFARLEETGIPLVWHVADPEEFWDPATTPEWAKSRGWGYDDKTVSKESLYAQVSTVLERHPKLRVILAHFAFLSANLGCAAATFERFPNVHFDLAPGVEYLYNLSKDIEASREFFVRYSSRIVFGTDLFAALTPDEARHRVGTVTRFLQSDEEFRLPDGADYLLGPPEEGIIRGMSLPEDALSQIYIENFQRLAGADPKPLDIGKAAEECERLAGQAEAAHGSPAKESEAARARDILLS